MNLAVSLHPRVSFFFTHSDSAFDDDSCGTEKCEIQAPGVLLCIFNPSEARREEALSEVRVT
jgi:hypothetical protein